jgi:hypothetical protein
MRRIARILRAATRFCQKWVNGSFTIVLLLSSKLPALILDKEKCDVLDHDQFGISIFEDQ